MVEKSEFDLLKKLSDDPLFKHALSLLSGSQVDAAKRYVEEYVTEVQSALQSMDLAELAALVTIEPNSTGSIGR